MVNWNGSSIYQKYYSTTKFYNAAALRGAGNGLSKGSRRAKLIMAKVRSYRRHPGTSHGTIRKMLRRRK